MLACIIHPMNQTKMETGSLAVAFYIVIFIQPDRKQFSNIS